MQTLGKSQFEINQHTLSIAHLFSKFVLKFRI
jgi:hypothetical protein